MIRSTRPTSENTGKERRLAVNAQNRTPLYHQLFLILRSQIYGGEYPEDSYLPSEHELVKQYHVSRITVVRALNELAASNLVIRRRGRGTRVNYAGKGAVFRGPYHSDGPADAGISSVVNGKIEGFLNSLRQRYDALSSAQLLHFDYEKAPPDIAEALKLRDDELVQCAVRVWTAQNGPFGHLTTHVPASIGRRWNADDIKRASLVGLLEQAGVTIGRVDERVTATLADSILADRLNVSVGSPLLKSLRTMYDQQARPIAHLTGLYPPDRYQYLMSLTRDQLGAPATQRRAKHRRKSK